MNDGGGTTRFFSIIHTSRSSSVFQLQTWGESSPLLRTLSSNSEIQPLPIFNPNPKHTLLAQHGREEPNKINGHWTITLRPTKTKRLLRSSLTQPELQFKTWQGQAWNGIDSCSCYQPISISNQMLNGLDHSPFPSLSPHNSSIITLAGKSAMTGQEDIHLPLHFPLPMSYATYSICRLALPKLHKSNQEHHWIDLDELERICYISTFSIKVGLG
jgi:hypothetical protein